MTAGGLRDDELVPLLTACTYDMPHVTDDDRRVLAYRLAHSPLVFLRPDPLTVHEDDPHRYSKLLLAETPPSRLLAHVRRWWGR